MGNRLEWIWDPVAWSSIPFTSHYSCCMQCSEQSDTSSWKSLTHGKILGNNDLFKICFLNFAAITAPVTEWKNISPAVLQPPINQAAVVFHVFFQRNRSRSGNKTAKTIHVRMGQREAGHQGSWDVRRLWRGALEVPTVDREQAPATRPSALLGDKEL